MAPATLAAMSITNRELRDTEAKSAAQLLTQVAFDRTHIDPIFEYLLPSKRLRWKWTGVLLYGELRPGFWNNGPQPGTQHVAGE